METIIEASETAFEEHGKLREHYRLGDTEVKIYEFDRVLFESDKPYFGNGIFKVIEISTKAGKMYLETWDSEAYESSVDILSEERFNEMLKDKSLR
jgi:hypothetical protein